MLKSIGHRRTYLALSCVGAFGSTPAFAEDTPATPSATDDGADRSDILVNGRRIRREPKEVAPLVDTPKSIVVLDKDTIARTGSNSLEDALRTVPGITFGAAEGGNPLGDRPFIRGFDSQGSIYVDGVRDLAAQTREVFATESVQIVRGSDSTLGGRGSAGGTINILSRLPEAEASASASGSYGNADYKRITGDLNIPMGNIAAFRIQGLYHDQNLAGRRALFANRWGFAPSFELGLGTPTRLIASYYHLESHALPDSGLPYLYTLANAPGTGVVRTEPAIGAVTTAGGQTGFVTRDTFYGLVNRDFRDTTTDQATLRVEHDFGGVTLRNTARYTHNMQAYIYTQPDDSQGNVYGTAAANPTTGAAGMRGDLVSGGYVWRRANTRYGYSESLVDQLDLSGTFSTGPIKHSFAAGAEVSWEKTRRGTFLLSSGSTIAPRCNTATVARYYCTSLFAPNPNDPFVNYTSDTSTVSTPIARNSTATETQNDASTQAIYAFDSITLVQQLILNLGVRYDRFKSVVALPVAAGAVPFTLSRTDDLFNWQAGLVFKPTASTSLYASYATAATPPNALLGEGFEPNALGTTNTPATLALLDLLRVTKTKTYEVGAKANLMEGRLNLSAAAFQTEIGNARVTGEDGTVQFIGNTRIRGLELSASGTIVEGWTVFGGYTHLDPRIVDGGFTILTAPAITQTAGGVTTTLQPARTATVVSVNTGRQVPQTARNSFTATTNVELFHRLSLGGTAIYMDTQFGGYADNRSATQSNAGVITVNPATKLLIRQIPSYWRFDLRAGFKVTPNIELSVNAQNVTDKVYFTQAYTTHYAAIATGRTVFGTLTAKF